LSINGDYQVGSSGYGGGRAPVPLSNKSNRSAWRETPTAADRQPRASSLQHTFYQLTSYETTPGQQVADVNYDTAYAGRGKFKSTVKVSQPPGNLPITPMMLTLLRWKDEHSIQLMILLKLLTLAELW
jgi:hypothetical protein